jgi:hypothetical protein
LNHIFAISLLEMPRLLRSQAANRAVSVDAPAAAASLAGGLGGDITAQPDGGVAGNNI